MEKDRFGNGFKTVALLLQMVLLIAIIVIFSLIVNLFSRSSMSFRDVGNHYSFFHSYYYTEEVKKELRELTAYLQLEPEHEKYKYYKLKFDNGESNFYYWFSDGEETFTNMEDAADKKDALSLAKSLGNYFYYDDSSVFLEGNFSHMDELTGMEILRLFTQSRGGGLIVAVDTALPKADAVAEAFLVYETYFPWIGFGLFAATILVMAFLLSMIYLTLATGRNGVDDKMRLHRIDYLPTELHMAAFLIFVTGLIAFCAKLRGKDWSISSSLILTGTLVFLSDVVFLTLYLSFVRKIKANIFMSCSLTAYMTHTLKEGMKKQGIKSRATIFFAGTAALEAFFLWEAFAKRHIWAIAGLVMIFLYLAVYFFEQAIYRRKLLEGLREITHGKLDYQFDQKEFGGDYRDLAEEINGIGEGLMRAVEENVKNERLKTELVTNVSHDIKTPLTSIINYIDLIKMEQIENEKIENYVSVLEKKSQRLKQLTEDLVEVSRITSGAIHLDMQPINFVELICQTGGEFNEIFEDVGLTVITRLPKDPVMILADGSRLWRVVQNLYNNVAKYAMKDTRVFVELKESDGYAQFSIKDISAQELKHEPQDLSERFVRGDESRGTEGSGLGLSIARHLTDLMGGGFEISLDGDLFTALITFRTIQM